MIFISALFSVLYYMGIMQRVVLLMAKMMHRLMGVSGSESLAAAANVFMGLTEAPIIVAPYIPGMTRSELMALMTTGMATVSGAVLGAYIALGVRPEYLLSASVMAAPAALVMAKLLIPETEQSSTAGDVTIDVEPTDVNIIDSAARGAGQGITLALNIGGMLIAFVAIIYMIDGILAYSQAGHGVREWERVDPNVLVPEVVDILSPPKGISVRIAPAMPTVQFSDVQFTQILQNLISNAVKHMDKPEGVIDVQGRDTSGFWEFSVADNGPGIPKKYHNRIFEVFQVLAPRDEKESTGVGLAIVKKIVEAGGGQVWVESKEGEGSTFYFTLPKLNDREKEGKGYEHEKHQTSVVS
ncbi:MAG: GHKL domain-containing protein [Planctomycetes bacterium]|nr:GHKL domain-containing protein [Planctomycetota bacterium]